MSNCRPGDLAVVIAGIPEKNLGRLVRVIEISPWATLTAGDQVWETDDPNYLYADCCLRPIRDPGDDAVDEMLQRVGKPESAAVEWALGTERAA